MEMLNKNTIFTLLKMQNFFDNSSGYSMFIPFLERYKEKNKDNIYINNILYEYKDFCYKDKSYISSEKVFDKIATIFSDGRLPIYLYDDAFWSLVSLERCNYNKCDWDNGAIKYTSENSKKNLISFMKNNQTKDQFVKFTEYLLKINNHDKLVHYWLQLLKQDKNKKYVYKKELFNFVKVFYHPKKEEKEILLAHAYFAFNTEESLELLKTLHKEANFNVSEVTKVLLEKANIVPKIKIIDFLHKDTEEEILYVNKKWINPEFIKKQKLFTKNEGDIFFNIVESYLRNVFKRQGVDSKFAVVKKYNEESGVYEEYFQIEIISKYSIQNETAKKSLDEELKAIMHVSSSVILLEAMKTKEIYLLHEYFEEFMSKSKLVINLEGNLEEKPSIKRNKI